MKGSVTYVTDNHFILIHIRLTNKAKFAVIAVPRVSFHNLLTQRRVAAFGMECL